MLARGLHCSGSMKRRNKTSQVAIKIPAENLVVLLAKAQELGYDRNTLEFIRGGILIELAMIKGGAEK